MFCVQGETALHLACHKGLSKLVEVLLKKGANPNTQTESTSLMGANQDGQGEGTPVTRQTPLHLALVNRFSEIVEIFLQYKSKSVNRTELYLKLTIGYSYMYSTLCGSFTLWHYKSSKLWEDCGQFAALKWKFRKRKGNCTMNQNNDMLILHEIPEDWSCFQNCKPLVSIHLMWLINNPRHEK